jgi:hypothetical protein
MVGATSVAPFQGGHGDAGYGLVWYGRARRLRQVGRDEARRGAVRLGKAVLAG